MQGCPLNSFLWLVTLKVSDLISQAIVLRTRFAKHRASVLLTLFNARLVERVNLHYITHHTDRVFKYCQKVPHIECIKSRQIKTTARNSM